MDEVAPNLYVGTLADAGDTALLHDYNVDSIVSLTHGHPESGFPVPVSNCTMMDGPRNRQETFRTAVEEVLAGLDRGETTLVHCSRGRLEVRQSRRQLLRSTQRAVSRKHSN